jgi:hypothetical protein
MRKMDRSLSAYLCTPSELRGKKARTKEGKTELGKRKMFL